MKRTTPLALVLILGFLGLALAKEVGPEIPGLDELVEQEGLFETTLIRPDTDFRKYDKLKSLDVTVRIRGRSERKAPAATGSVLAERSGSRPAFSSDEVAQLEGVFRTAFGQGLGGSESFEVVEESSPETLLLRAAAVDMASKRASRSARKSGHGERRLTAGLLVVDVFDGKTGLLLARVAERGKIDEAAEQAGSENPWPEVVPWAEHAASKLLQELEEIRGESPDDSASSES